MKASHEGPAELSAHSNPYQSDKDNDMSRENLPTDEYIDLASEAAAIAAGDVIATQIFNKLDEQVLSENFEEDSAVRQGVNVLGPGLVGALVFTMSDNEIVERVAVGHALTTVRRAVDEGMSLLTDDDDGSGSSSDSETSGYLPSASQSLEGRMLSEPGANAAATTTSTGGGTSGSTMIQGG